MEEKQRDTSGRYSRSVDDAEVLAAVRAHDPAATSEVAEEVGISRQGTDRRLRALRDVGEVSSKKIGASLVWFMPRDTGSQPPRDARGSPETRPRDERDQSAAAVTDTPSTTDAAGEAGDVIDAAVDKAAESWEDDEARLAARKNAARAVLEGLRERPMSRGEMVERYYDDYDISGQSEDTWYRKNLAECENAPLKAVASYNSGTRKWEFDASGGDR